MCGIPEKVRQFLLSEDGATATEYAVMLALVILACMGAVAALGTKVSGLFSQTEQEWSNYYP
ncbi:MAG TPA: Flp family type IVb pilin [Phycisphaerae bacterium]|nr:Flp family type IVb pilin [Phycisphaerae bacterium]HRW51594.1 Flp family type IVb pilin [Phycisphaerae bacterium]